MNSEKCGVMDFGKLNQGRGYAGHGKALGRVPEQGHLGVQELQA